jgi:hypothetical protein
VGSSTFQSAGVAAFGAGTDPTLPQKGSSVNMDSSVLSEGASPFQAAMPVYLAKIKKYSFGINSRHTFLR